MFDRHVSGGHAASLDFPLLGQEEVEVAVEALYEGAVGIAAPGAGVAVVGGEVVGREVEPLGYGQLGDGQGRSGEGLGAEVLPDEALSAVVLVDLGTLHDEVGVVLVEQAQVEVLAVADGQGYLVGELGVEVRVTLGEGVGRDVGAEGVELAVTGAADAAGVGGGQAPLLGGHVAYEYGGEEVEIALDALFPGTAPVSAGVCVLAAQAYLGRPFRAEALGCGDVGGGYLLVVEEEVGEVVVVVPGPASSSPVCQKSCW